MVLQGAAAPNASEGFQDDSSPNSDLDRYSSPSNPLDVGNGASARTPPGYVIDLDRLPKPFPIISPLFGYTQARRLEIANAAVASMSAIVERPLSREECDAILYHVAKGGAIRTWGEPLGIAAGLYRWYATRKDFKFPFWKPGSPLNLDKFLGLGGTRARGAWAACRFGAYGLVGLWGGQFVIGSYAGTTAAVGTRNDPRLKDLVKTMSEVGDKEAIRRMSSTPEWDRRRGGQRGGSAPEQAPAVEDYGGVMPEGDTQYDQSASQKTLPTTEATTSATWSSDRSLPSRSSSPPTSSAPASFTLDDFDDASPTAPQPRSDYKTQSGSAWDRLRRGSGQPQPQTQMSPPPVAPKNMPSENAWAKVRGKDNVKQEQQDGSTAGDSFSFSNSDEEKQLARREAQRDFDVRVERERRGENFDEDKRWR